VLLPLRHQQHDLTDATRTWSPYRRARLARDWRPICPPQAAPTGRARTGRALPHNCPGGRNSGRPTPPRTFGPAPP
jgi:hypothetical protein